MNGFVVSRLIAPAAQSGAGRLLPPRMGVEKLPGPFPLANAQGSVGLQQTWKA